MKSKTLTIEQKKAEKQWL